MFGCLQERLSLTDDQFLFRCMPHGCAKEYCLLLHKNNNKTVNQLLSRESINTQKKIKDLFTKKLISQLFKKMYIYIFKGKKTCAKLFIYFQLNIRYKNFRPSVLLLCPFIMLTVYPLDSEMG